MEKTILYINDEYCLTLEQLKAYFAMTPKHGTRLYNELLTMQCDNMFARWLEQGSTDEELELAKDLENLPDDMDDSKMMAELIRLFTGKKAMIDKPHPSIYLHYPSVECFIKNDNKRLNVTQINAHKYEGNIEIFRQNDTIPQVMLKMSFKMKRKGNERFTIRLISDDGRVLYSQILSPQDYSVGSLVSVDSPYQVISKPSTTFRITVDGETWTSFTLSVVVGEKTFVVGDVSFKMIFVKGGRFLMGAAPEFENGAVDDEKPAHWVTLSDYCIGETQVTQELWQAVMGNNPSAFIGKDRPVEQISRYDCHRFVDQLNELLKGQLGGGFFHLPTEAQWEYVARDRRTRGHYKFAGSDDIDEVAWYSRNSSGTTHDVKGKEPNWLGLYDLSGNVWEWCQDWKDSYNSDEQIDPMGPKSGVSCVARGGSWHSKANSCRVLYRNSCGPDTNNGSVGLRLALWFVPSLKPME